MGLAAGPGSKRINRYESVDMLLAFYLWIFA